MPLPDLLYDQLLDLAKLLESFRKASVFNLEGSIMDVTAEVAFLVKLERCHPSSDESLVEDLFIGPNFEQVLHECNESLLAQSAVDFRHLCIQVVHYLWHFELELPLVGPRCCYFDTVEQYVGGEI